MHKDALKRAEVRSCISALETLKRQDTDLGYTRATTEGRPYKWQDTDPFAELYMQGMDPENLREISDFFSYDDWPE